MNGAQCENAVRSWLGTQLTRGPDAGAGAAGINVYDAHTPVPGHLEPAGIRGIQVVDVGAPEHNEICLEQFVDLRGAAVHANHETEHVGGR